MLDDIRFQQHCIQPLPLFEDNYAWVIHCGKAAWVIDPGHADETCNWLAMQELELQGVIITHSHWDHVGGIDGLKRLFPKLPVYGPPNIHPGINHHLEEGDYLAVEGLNFEVWHTPGHIHLSYYCANAGWLMCGDTLFSAGCGRVKQSGNLEQLFNSLQRIAQLPSDTLIFCAHEYTLSNLKFAQAVEPSNSAIIEYTQRVHARRELQKPSLPSLLRDELAINPFLRLEQPEVQRSIGQKRVNTIGTEQIGLLENFRELRQWKDVF